MDIKFAFQEAYAALAGAKRLLIMAHQKPDGDTLGSAAALGVFYRRHGAQVTVFCRDPLPEQFAYLPGAELFTADPAVFQEPDYDALVVVDAGNLHFAGVADLIAAMPRRPLMVAFDHHATNAGYADTNVIDAGASSTAEVICRFFETCDVTVDDELATCLFTGIFTDTDGFANGATNTAALDAAARLIRRGAPAQAIAARLTHNRPLPALRLWGLVLSRLKYDADLGIASTAVLLEDGREGASDQVEGIANFLGNFLDAKVILVLKETTGGMVKGSFRTVEEIDVSAVAKALGGGGHRKAAGFSLPGRIVETAANWRVE